GAALGVGDGPRADAAPAAAAWALRGAPRRPPRNRPRRRRDPRPPGAGRGRTGHGPAVDVTDPPVTATTVGRRVALLAAQAFFLGLMTAWVMIPASAMFLDVYGPGLLPYTYIGAAVAGIAGSAALAAALRRRPLVS